jgi:hypothetical protein
MCLSSYTMFNEMRAFLVLLAGVLMLGVAVPATASPPAENPQPAVSAKAKESQPKRTRVARFDLKFVARQSTRWHYNQQRRDECSGSVIRSRGAGTQTMVARIPKVRVTVARVPEVIVGDTVTRMWPTGSKKVLLAPWKVRVQVNRAATGSSRTIVPPERPCAEGGPDAREPEPDCGTRTLRGRLDLLPPFARQGFGLGIETGGPYTFGEFNDLVDEAYSQCEFNGPQRLMKTGMAVISRRKLFGRNPRLIAFDSREKSSGPATNRSRTTTKWRMVLTRVGQAK